MNSLEQYVRENKSLFDEEPAAGHFERLQIKMERKSGRIIALRSIISIAASIAIIMSAGIVWKYAAKRDIIVICENASDMKICYLDRMNELAGQIEELITDFDQWDRQMVMSDVQDIIEAVSGDFESELPEELPEDMTKEILSDYYRRNLEGMEMIVESIKN